MSIPDDPFGTASAGGSLNPSKPHSPAETAMPTPGSAPRPAAHNPTAANPAGNGSSGTKTPRRVQWTSDHIVSIAPSAARPDSEASELSPPNLARLSVPDRANILARNALSPTNSEFDQASLKEIETALARHQSQRSAARANLLSSRYSNHSNQQPDIEEDITAAATPGDDEDYDYRLDTTDHNVDPEESEIERTYRRNQQSGRRFFGGHSGGHSSGLSSAASSIMGDDDEYGGASGREGQSAVDLEKQEHPPGTIHGPGGPIHPSATGPPPKGLIPEEPELPDDIHQHMHVYVDPGETDGMPSMPVSSDVPGVDGETTLAQEASALVRAHKSGKFGNFMRNRKKNVANGIQGTANGVTGVASGVASGVAGGVTAGGRMGRRATNWFTGNANTVNGGTGNYPSESKHNEKLNPSRGIAGGLTGVGAMGAGMGSGGAAGGALAGGGVLASLLALYDNGQNGQSGASTPASSRPTSIALSSDSDSSDDERERERLRKLRKREDKERRAREEKERRTREERERKARKAEAKALQGQERAKTSRPTSFVGPVALASAIGGRPRGETTTSAGSAPSAITSPIDNSDVLALQQRSTSHGSFDDRRPRESPKLFNAVKKAADRLGIDVDDHKSGPARNGGGVFGALIQNTGRLSSVATPAASTLMTDRPASLYARSESHLPLDGFDKESPTHSGDTLTDGSGMAPLTRSITTDDRDMVPPRLGGTLPPSSGGLKRPNKPFSLGLSKLGSMPHMPLTPGGSAFKSASHFFGSRSQNTTPNSAISEKDSDYFGEKVRLFEEEERRRKEEKRRKKKAKEKKRKQEIFIIQHVAAILARQQFILKLVRCFMMFGSPSHRLEAQIQATARVLELNCQVVYLPGTCLVSFGDDATHTSETKFLKQATGLDLQKLLATHHVYWDVVHDKKSAEEASKELDLLMTSPPHYGTKEMLIIGGMCSSFICCIAFYGSFVDALISFPLGALLIFVQIIAARNDLYSNVFEISIATISSFLAAALAASPYFCYTAVASSAIVLILPGYIVLSGSLELASRNITSGSVRIGYAVIYSLFLGFGLSIGAEIFNRITDRDVAAADWSCAQTHYAGAPWWLVTPSAWWYFLIAPGYSFFLSLRQQQPIWRKETPTMVVIACAGWATNHFSGQAFPNRSDISSMLGSFVVGVLGNIWGRFNKGTSFVVMLVGVLFQLPSGLGNGGLFNFVQEGATGSTTTYSAGFSVAQQLVSVAIGLTVGLFLAALVVHPFGGGRRRGGAGIFSF
ncbi:hypothetical protein NliqN6_2705 [Naganishia liquefaciens]|uniref:DUF1212-domain-containing protein n=1 Tax=Naganishia liquefaciens TaxID=104408 RepID=A0A8H3YEI7_9TREE|nr:hypothetical protein NliqN6_2705 [Naganishia liquefaciens]